MEDRFSAQQIRRRQQRTLIKILKRCATPDAESVAAKLRSYAAQVITTPDQYAATLQLSLQHHIKHYRCLQENIDQLLSEIALVLAQTQGAFLTSIKGVKKPTCINWPLPRINPLANGVKCYRSSMR